MDSDGNETYQYNRHRVTADQIGQEVSSLLVAPLMEKLTQSSQFPRLLSQGSASIQTFDARFRHLTAEFRFGQMQMAFEGIPHPSYHKGMALLEYCA